MTGFFMKEVKTAVRYGPYTLDGLDNFYETDGVKVKGYRYDEKATEKPFSDVVIKYQSDKLVLTPFGKKIVTGISSLVMAAITIIGYKNIIR